MNVIAKIIVGDLCGMGRKGAESIFLSNFNSRIQKVPGVRKEMQEVRNDQFC